MGGTLEKGEYDVLTTQYNPPATDLSNYASKSNLTFTGTQNAGVIVASWLSHVDSNTNCNRYYDKIHNINDRYNNSVNYLTPEQQNVFNNWVGITTGETLGVGGEVGLTLWSRKLGTIETHTRKTLLL